MARRSDYNRKELKEMAIVTGQRIISEEGFNKFSARKVAKGIGYTVGTIYNIFASHNDLILHLNATTLDDMYLFINKHRDKEQIGANAIKNLSSSYVRFAKENYNRWIVLFEYNPPQDVSLPDWYKVKIKVLFTLVEATLLHILKNDKEKAERAAKILWAGIHGICQLSLTGKLDKVGAESIQILTNDLIDNFIKGMK